VTTSRPNEDALILSHLDAAELEALFSLDYALKHVDKLFQRFT